MEVVVIPKAERHRVQIPDVQSQYSFRANGSHVHGMSARIQNFNLCIVQVHNRPQANQRLAV